MVNFNPFAPVGTGGDDTPAPRATPQPSGGGGFSAFAPLQVNPDAGLDTSQIDDQRGGGGGGFLGAIGDIAGAGADAFRDYTPKGARDFAGDVINNTLSGERFLNTVGNAIGEGDVGTNISQRLREVDKIGGLLAIGFDVAASPATLLTAGFGGQIAAGLNAGRLGTAGKIAAAVVEPVTGGTAASPLGKAAQRYAAENILGTSATAVGAEVNERLEGANPILRGATTLVTGALGGSMALRTTSRKLPGLVGREIVVAPGLTVPEQQIKDWRAGRLNLDEIVQAKTADEVLDNLGFFGKLKQSAQAKRLNPDQQPGFFERIIDKVMPKDQGAQALIRHGIEREQAHNSYVALEMVDFGTHLKAFDDTLDGKTGNVRVRTDARGEPILSPEQKSAMDGMRGSLDREIDWERRNGLDPQEMIGERDAYAPLDKNSEVEITFAEAFERYTGGHYFPRQVVEKDGIVVARGQLDPFTVAQRAPGFADDVPEAVATMQSNLQAGVQYSGNIRQVFEDRLIAGGRRANAKWLRDTASSPVFGGRTIGQIVDDNSFGLRTTVAHQANEVRRMNLRLEKLVSKKLGQTTATRIARAQALRSKQLRTALSKIEEQELRSIEAAEKIRRSIIDQSYNAETHRKAKSTVNRPTAKTIKDHETGLQHVARANDQLDKIDTLLNDAFEAKLMTEAEITSQRAQLEKWRNRLETNRAKIANIKELAASNEAKVGQTIIPQLGGRSFANDFAKTISEAITPQSEGTIVQRIGGFNNVARALMATMDLSAAGIQGLIALGAHPIQAANALRIAWSSLVDPEIYARNLRQRRGVLDEFVKLNGHFALDDTGEFAFPRAVSKIPGLGKVFDLSNLAFTRTGNMMRLTMFEAALETNRFKGLGFKGALTGGVPEADARRIVQTINAATGFSNGRPTSWEKVGLFAPRYFRSQLDLIGKALVKGGPESAYAQTLLFKTVMLGTMLTVAINEARGESTDFNPLRENADGGLSYNTNFLRIRNLGGKDISMFAGWDSLAGLMTTLAVQGPYEGIKRIGRTKASPLASTVYDIIEGQTFDGQRVDISTPEGFMNAVITESLNKIPFTAQDTIEGWKNGEWVPVGAAANFFGVKSAPVTSYEQRDMLAQEMFQAHWNELTGKEKEAVEAARPQLFDNIASQTEERAGLGDPRAKASLEREKIDQDRLAEESALGRALAAGTITMSQFEERYQTLQASSADQKRRVDEFAGITYAESKDPNQQALGAWYDLGDKANIPGTGIRDWDLWNEIESSFMATLTPEQTRFVQERSRPEHAPELQWYFTAKQIVSDAGYYATVDAAYGQLAPALNSMGSVAEGINSYSDLMAAIADAKAVGDVAKEVQLDAIADAIQRTAGAQKELLRIQNPALDQALLQLGRVSRPLAPRPVTQ